MRGPQAVRTYTSGAGDTVDRAKIVWPDGYFVSYGYDAASRMTSATDSDGTALATRTYDQLGRVATIQYPFANDNIGYSWTNEDDLLTLANNLAGGAANDVTYTNTFTPAHQWYSSNISNAAFKYAPPASGTDSYGAPNGLNQYTNVTPAGGTAQAISYDTRGNLTSDGVLTLAYDPENRLMTASKTGMSASYAYDPLGRRTAKTVNGTTTNFLHDGDNEIAEYGSGTTLLRRFVPGPAIDQPIAMITCTGAGCASATATKTMFHVDKMGSIVAMSNATDGKLAPSGGPFVYDPYGNCTTAGAPCSTAGTPFLYTGQRFDPETGLYYYRARCYSPTLGRFCQTDPVGYKDDLNLYLAMHDDPTNKTDPLGLWQTCPDNKNCVESTTYNKDKNHVPNVRLSEKDKNTALNHSSEFKGTHANEKFIVGDRLEDGKDSKTDIVPGAAESGSAIPPDGATAVEHDHPTAGPHMTDGLIDASPLGDDQSITQHMPNVAINGNRAAAHEAPDGHLRMTGISGTLTQHEKEVMGERLDMRQQALEQHFASQPNTEN